MVAQHYRWDFIGLSTDSKPTPATSEKVADGSTFYCSDNSKLYVWYNDQWYEKTSTGGGGGDGGVKTLTSADYNYPTDNPTTIASWLLEPGYYKFEGVRVYLTVNSYTDNGVVMVGKAPSNNQVPIIACGYGRSLATVVVDKTNGHMIAMDQNFSPVIINDIVNDLTTGGSKKTLSAEQGKVLKGLIDGRVNTNAGAPTTATVGTVGQLIEDTTNGKLYQCTAITPGTAPDPDTYTWSEVGGGSGPTVVQTAGTSTTDVMSQDATTKMVYADGATKQKITIGQNSATNGSYCIAIGANSATSNKYSAIAIGGANSSTNASAAYADYSIAIGAKAKANARNSVAIGYGANADRVGEVNIGATNGAGYSDTNYRVLGGVYDPVNAHDAATKGYVDSTHAVLYANVSNLVNESSIEFYKEATLTTKWNVGEIGDLLLKGASITMVSKKSSESEYDTRKNYQMVTCYYPYAMDDDSLNETEMRMVFRDQASQGQIPQYQIQTSGPRSGTEWYVSFVQV